MSNLTRTISSGDIFGDWTIIGFSGTKNTQAYYQVVCACGVKKEVARNSLVKGRSKSCGCKRSERFLASIKADRTTNRNGKELGCLSYRHDRIEHLYITAYRNSIHDRKKFSGSDLSFDEWKKLVDSPCNYCGMLGGRNIRDFSSKGNLVSNTILKINGVDRVDSGLPYTIGNVVPCCNTCNMMKNEMSADDFLSHIKRILNHLGSD